jgi:hypothetical protein
MDVGEYLMYVVVLACPFVLDGIVAMGSYVLVVAVNGEVEKRRTLLC